MKFDPNSKVHQSSSCETKPNSRLFRARNLIILNSIHELFGCSQSDHQLAVYAKMLQLKIK